MKNRFHFSYRSGLLAMLVLSSIAAQAHTATEAWVRRYNSAEAGSLDYARKVVTDPDGNVVVAGDTDDGITRGVDILIIKYSGAGIPLWTNRYNGPTNTDDKVSDLAVDNRGNVFVAGSSGAGTPREYVTVAYSRTGVPLWTNRYNGPAASALAADHNGNVFVTGYSFGNGNDWDYATIAYSGAGVPLWTNRYNYSSDRATDVAVDRNGNVFVTGFSLGNGVDWDYATIAYSGAGVPLWTNRYNGTGNAEDRPNALAVDSGGNVFVTGYSVSTGSVHHDFATVAYSGAGVPLWTNRYSGPDNLDDYATALAVDHNGNVFVTGSSATIAYSGAGVALWTNNFGSMTAVAVDNDGNVVVTGSSGRDYVTIKYSGEGLALWTNRHDGLASSFDEANDISVDSGGNVFVTGHSRADFATIGYSAAGLALWTNYYNGPGNSDDRASAIVVDHNSGNVFVAGEGNDDYVTIAYSEVGMALWTNRYNGPGNSIDRALAVAVDARGNVVVTGSSQGGDSSIDYATIAYSASGVPLWTNRYNGLGNGVDRAIAVAVDRGGDIVVTGYSTREPSNYDYVTIAYSSAGIALWTNHYNGPGNSSDRPTALALHGNGNVFVTGSSSTPGGSYVDYATVAYSGAGVALWTNRYTAPGESLDNAHAVAVDHQGNVFVTGYSTGDYATIAYSGAGVPLWTNRYNGWARAIAVDHRGNVFVTGDSTGIGSSSDYVTIAYSGAGVALWTNRYNGPANGSDRPTTVAADRDGNVFVTGYSDTWPSFDYATIAYSAGGVALWTNYYNGPANGPDAPMNESWLPGSWLAIGRDGAVYVTGSSDGNYSDFTAYDYATIKYVWRPHLAVQPLTAASSTVNLTLSAPSNSPWHILRAPTITGPWTNLGVSLIGTNGSISFRDANPPANGAFYRIAPP